MTNEKSVDKKTVLLTARRFAKIMGDPQERAQLTSSNANVGHKITPQVNQEQIRPSGSQANPLEGQGTGQRMEGGQGSGRHRSQPDWMTQHQRTTVPGTSVPGTDMSGTSVPKFEGQTPQSPQGQVPRAPQKPMMPGQAPPSPPKPGEAPQGSKPVPDNAERHGQFAYGLGMQSVQDAQQKLQQQGYRLTGTSAHMGDSLVHTYSHPEGHTIELHSDDGNMVSGIEYAIPKPSKPQNPGSNVFQANGGAMGAQQPQRPQPQAPQPQQPQQPQAKPNVLGQPSTLPKQDMPAYQGGAASMTGQGSKSFIPKGIVLGPGEQMGGAGRFCSICHTAVGTVVHYKGLEVCRRCASITPGVSRQSVKK